MKTVNRSELPVIGSEIGGGFMTGEIVIAGIHYALITSGKEAEIKGEWGKYGTKIASADSFVDGLSNTNAMAEAGLEIAITVRAMRFGGNDDWAIPARNQQELQYRNLKPTNQENLCSYLDGYNPDSVPAGELYNDTNPLQTTAEAFRQGGAEALVDSWYWSSTQSSADTSFCQYFNNGTQYTSNELSELLVRPVRMIQIIN